VNGRASPFDAPALPSAKAAAELSFTTILSIAIKQLVLPVSVTVKVVDHEVKTERNRSATHSGDN
jgi:hypothetical protein